ncbi:putative major pilin subunit [Yersinia pseudotuberculosis]|nr:putative major pilin subunit [Yersinia pseudotuberculosis]
MAKHQGLTLQKGFTLIELMVMLAAIIQLIVYTDISFRIKTYI